MAIGKHADHDKAADERQLVEEPPLIAPAPVLFGNEGYLPTRLGGRSVQPPAITQEEWLLEAKEAQAVLLRGDHVSPELIERLFLQSVPVIETAVPPVTRAKKRNGDDDDDPDKKHRG
jgi:hypothetical protein